MLVSNHDALLAHNLGMAARRPLQANHKKPFRASMCMLFYPTEAHTGSCRPLIQNKQKIVVAHAASPYKHSLKDVFDNPGIANQIKVR